MSAVDFIASPPDRRDDSSDESQRDRALRLLGTEVEYVYSPRFDDPDEVETILGPLDDPEVERRRSEAAATRPPSDMPAYVAELYRVPLLTPLQEVYSFRRMNYLLHRANQLRSRLDPDRPDVSAMDRIETKLGDALRIRNDIVRANLRLIVALARRLTDDTSTFDDLVAEGHLPLIRAVELFDVDKGFRFSTYATWAVRNNLHRHGPNIRKRRRRFPTGQDVVFDAAADAGGSLLRDLLNDADRREQTTMFLDELEPRDRVVVEARFGLGDEPRPHRFREIGERLNLSTERVRQLFLRSMDRLREDAGDEFER